MYIRTSYHEEFSSNNPTTQLSVCEYTLHVSWSFAISLQLLWQPFYGNYVRMYMYCTYVHVLYVWYVSQCSMYIVYMCAVWMCLSLHSLVRLTSCLVTVKIWKCSMRCTGAYCGTWGKGACRQSFVFLHVYVSVHYTCKYNYSTYMYMYIVLYCLQYDYTYKHATGLSKYW